MFVLIFLFLFASANAYGLQVNTTEGVVEGYNATDGVYYEFHGIPYAGPTDGEHRFKAPIPPLPHQGVFHANKSNIICAQPAEGGMIGVENCLTLSIFTNSIWTPKPVIVWLNAEDYTTANPHKFSFRSFVQENIVFVNLNFRLSVFGFLCLGVEEAPGNAGLRDVIQGLKWIKANIANFGGDPNNVVLMGHASGAAMIDLLTIAPQSEGLMHKAITLSGSGIASWAVAYDPVGYARLFGTKLGYTDKSKATLAKHLMATNTTLLNSALLEFTDFKNNTPLFAPCIENITLSANDTILADAPIKLIHSGKYLQIPYLAGYTSREGTMRAREAVNGDWLSAMNNKFSDFLPVDLALDGKNATNVVKSISNKYFKHDRPNLALNDTDAYLKYEGDILIAMPVIKGAKERGATSAAEVRLFVFGYSLTDDSDWTFKQIPLEGVRHGGILNYLFDKDLKLHEKRGMQTIMNYFTTFAHNGTQNSSIFGSQWKPITSDRFFTYFFAHTNNIGYFIVDTEDQLMDTYALWDDIYSKYHKPPRAANYTYNPNSAINISSSFCVVFISVIFLTLREIF